MKLLSILPYFTFAASIFAASPDYFPLQVGNQWVLETTSTPPQTLNTEILRSRVINDTTYFLVTGYALSERWIRKADDGTLYALDPKSGQETPLARLSLGAPSYQSALSGCEQPVEPSTKPAPYNGPNFQADQSLILQYSPGNCRDVGFTSEVYAAGIGLLHRSMTSFRGEITFDLIYARVNGSPLVGKSKQVALTYDFNRGSKGWLAGFTDYDLQTSDLRILAELRALPDEVNRSRSAFYIQSMNRSDDLFMYLKKQVTTDDGLEANRPYQVSFNIRFSSNAPSGCAGAGGAPGESVYLKAGSSIDEPLALLNGSSIRLSVDKGQQSVGGQDLGVVGTISNGTACDGTNSQYVSVTKQYTHPNVVRTDDRGSLWLLVGTDSAYEGLTGLYVESISVRINPAAE